MRKIKDINVLSREEILKYGINWYMSECDYCKDGFFLVQTNDYGEEEKVNGLIYEQNFDGFLYYYEFYYDGFPQGECVEFNEDGAVISYSIVDNIELIPGKIKKYNNGGIKKLEFNLDKTKKLSYRRFGCDLGYVIYDEFDNIIEEKPPTVETLLKAEKERQWCGGRIEYDMFAQMINFGLIDEAKAVEIQEELREQINTCNLLEIEEIRFVAGIDLVYWNDEKTGQEWATCCIVVVNIETLEVVEKFNLEGEIKFPYQAGFLTFRELPLIIKAIDKIQTNVDLYMFDGNGYLHPRNMGIATHAGLYLDKPTIGVSKSYYKVADVDFTMPENEENAYTDIFINGETYGRAFRSHKDVKPIFISVGNNIDLDTSTKIVSKLITKESRIPVPTRLADMETRIVRSSLNSVE